MACIPLPTVPAPSLPAGITLGPPPTPPVPGADANLCCKLPPIPTPPPIPPIPAILMTGAVVAAFNKAVAGILSYLDKLPLDCPRE